MRQPQRMRRQQDSKSSSCTETAEVDVAGISVEVSAHYPGRSPVVFRRAELAWPKGCDEAVRRSQQKP